MKTTFKTVLALSTAVLLASCSSFPISLPSWGSASAPAPAPALTSEQTAQDGDAAYGRARALHVARRFDDAFEAYGAGLQAFPTHVNLRNGLATLYAEQGDLEHAIALWRALATEAGAGGPDTAFLFANLGYGYLLNKDYDHALAALQTATVLDPENARALRNLGTVLEKTGQGERAQAMYQRASAVQAAPAASSATAPTVPSAGAAPAPATVAADTSKFASTELRAGGNGTVELRRGGLPPPLKAQPATPAEHEEVLKAVHAWADAWSARDVKAYLGMYGANFETPKGQARQAWSAQRRSRIEGKASIRVKVEAPQVTLAGNAATVTFRQLYEAGRLHEDSKKTLVLEKQDNKWQIRQERSDT